MNLKQESWIERYRFFLIILVLFAGSCGGSSSAEAPTVQPTDQQPGQPGETAYAPTTSPFGGYRFQCQGGQAAQQKVKYQDFPGGEGCSSQLEFVQSELASFQVDLDCSRRKVNIQSTSNTTEIEVVAGSFPIQSDGGFQGSLRFREGVKNDGYGNLFCIVESIAIFRGRAFCDFSPGSGRYGESDLQMTTEIQFEVPDSYGLSSSVDDSPNELPSVQPIGPSPSISVTPSVSPSVEPSPSATPTLSPSPYPTPTYTPRPSPSPSPLPSPSPSPSPTHTHRPTPRPRPVPTHTPTPSFTSITRVSCFVSSQCPKYAEVNHSCR